MAEVGVCRVWEGLGGKGRVIIISKNKKIKEIIITILINIESVHLFNLEPITIVLIF